MVARTEKERELVCYVCVLFFFSLQPTRGKKERAARGKRKNKREGIGGKQRKDEGKTKKRYFSLEILLS